MKLRYTDRAKEDVELAFAWYERQRRGLGFDFFGLCRGFPSKHPTGSDRIMYKRFCKSFDTFHRFTGLIGAPVSRWDDLKNRPYWERLHTIQIPPAPILDAP